MNKLISKINNIEKEESLFTQTELNKYILFTFDKTIKKLEINCTDSNFVIPGKTNKALDVKITGKLSFSDTNNKNFDCELDAKDKNNASMLCHVNVSQISEEYHMEKLNFEEEEIIGNDNNAYLNGLKEIEIFSKKIQIIINDDKDKDNNNNNIMHQVC